LTCWVPRPCGAVRGAAAPKACSARGLLPCGCALLTVHWYHMGSIFLGKPHGWCAKRAPAASANITSPITRPIRREGRWYAQLRPAGTRAGASATQGRTWPGPLRGQILAGAAPSCVTDDDGIYLSAASTLGQYFTGGGKNRQPTHRVRHPSRHCRQYAAPFSSRCVP
jgi:hypothetical protein